MLSSLDTVVEEWITRHRTATLVDIARIVTLAGDSRVVGAVAVAGGVVLALRRHRLAVLAASVAGWLAVEIIAGRIKALTDRPLPPYEHAVIHLTNSSMPAAHVGRATFALVVLGLVLPRTWRRPFAAVAALVVVAVAWSRLELGTHWLTDTIAAWPLGLLAAAPLVYLVHQRRRTA